MSDIDLYCLHCGYNLRGLSGDPRRCPECGKLSPLTPSEEMIARELRRMETWPTACVAATALLLGSFAVLVLVRGDSTLFLKVCAFCLLSLSISLPIWFAGMEQFGSDCMYQPGWKVTLAQYHLHGITLCLLMASAVGIAVWLLRNLFWDELVGVTGLVACLVAVSVVLPLARRIRRRCKAKMNTLQRAVAVTRAKVCLHERLTRRRS